MVVKRPGRPKTSVTPDPVITPEQQVLIHRYGPAGARMRKRTRYEVNDFLDMIAQQGAAAEERGLKILAAYEQDAERRALDDAQSGRVFDAPFAKQPHNLKGRGHSLRDWIADRTKAVFGDKA
jgi:hypothetical protein